MATEKQYIFEFQMKEKKMTKNFNWAVIPVLFVAYMIGANVVLEKMGVRMPSEQKATYAMVDEVGSDPLPLYVASTD
jgi:hypothetical protein